MIRRGSSGTGPIWRWSPPLEEVACVREDLTDECEPHGSLLHLQLPGPSSFFTVQGVRPVRRGMWGKGVCVGTFCCAADGLPPREHGMACLGNVELDLSAMPTLEQAHAVIRHYGPTLFFHPKEVYLPSSVSWFFKNGAALYKRGGDTAGARRSTARGPTSLAGVATTGSTGSTFPAASGAAPCAAATSTARSSTRM